MMTLESLHLTNFKRYATFEITFESGLCGILGRNGSGKSTLFEAVGFALYGFYRGSKELIRTVGETGSVSVELAFVIDEKRYRVTREFRGKNLTAFAVLYEGDDSIATGVKEVNAAVTKLLGMSRDAFLHTVFASQKELTALSSMRNEDRKTMMRRLLGLEKLDAIETMIREELRDLNRDLKNDTAYLMSDGQREALNAQHKAKSEEAAQLQTQITSMEVTAQTLKTAHLAAKKAVEIHQQAKEARHKAAEQLERAKQVVAMHEKECAGLDGELAKLQSEQTRYNELLPLKAKLADAEKTLAAHEALRVDHLKKEGLEREQTQLRQEFASRKAEVAQLTKAIEPLEALKTRLTQERALADAQKTAVQQMESKLTEVTGRIAANRSKIHDVQERVMKITGLGSDSPCPVCTRPLLEQYDAVLNGLHREINDVYQKQIDAALTEKKTLETQRTAEQKKLTDAEAQSTATDKQIALLLSKAEDLQKARQHFIEVKTRGENNKVLLQKLGAVDYDAKTHETVRQEVIELRPQVESMLSLEALIKTIPAKTEARRQLAAQIETDKNAVLSAQNNLETTHYSEKEHAEAVEAAALKEAEKEAHIKDLHALSLKHVGMQRDIEAIAKEIRNDDDRRAAFRQKTLERNDYNKLKAIMLEFKTHINARIAPRIGELAGEMYARITRGRYQHIEVSPEFDFYIFDQGEKYPIERFSGGEIDLANLVLRIAISRTLSELSGSSIGFLAFDEIFGSQDEERRFQIMEALHTISESYRQIFLISHETEIKEMFERVVAL